MLFNSLQFLIFFPAVVVVFFLLPHRFRWILLLAASYYFYMSWNPAYGLLLFGTTVIAYIAAIQIERHTDVAIRKLYLYGCLMFSLGILFFFKYFNFFFDSIAPIVNMFSIDFNGPTLRLLLPVGISFYIFQALSYVIDIYRGTSKAERHFGVFALYKSFFPQLVAGPIERASHMLPQFHAVSRPDPARFTSGLRLMLWGAFKKIVVADNASIVVAAAYADPTNASGITLAIGTIFFAIQIYGDFSGYSDIARGSARILGYDLVLNFKQPYFVRSIADFWHRWHISLTGWFQHYVFTPLYMALSRTKTMRVLPKHLQHTTSFIITTLIGLTLLGLWHGANMTFILFGLSQALFIILHHLIKKWWDRLPFFIANMATLLMVLVGFVFFRAATVSDAFVIFRNIATETFLLILHPTLLPTHMLDAAYSLGVNRYQLGILVFATLLLFIAEWLFEKKFAQSLFQRTPRMVRWCAYYILILIILFAGNFGETAFIYFQF